MRKLWYKVKLSCPRCESIYWKWAEAPRKCGHCDGQLKECER